MSSSQTLSDKVSIGLSFVCAVHCLAMPVLVAVLPAAVVLPLEGEAFHFWLACLVLPISVLALFMGCRQHRSWGIVACGVAGLLLLGVTAVFGHDLFGESGEKIATVIAVSALAFAHFLNYRTCAQLRDAACDCRDCG